MRSPSIKVDASWFGATGIGRFAEEILQRSPLDVDVMQIRTGERNASVMSPLLLRFAFESGSSSRAFWSPGFMPPALSRSIWQSVTVHDLNHLHFYGSAHRVYYNLVIKPLLRRMDLVFTVSEYSRQEIVSWAGLPAERVVAVPHGLSSAFSSEGSALDLGRPYVLYVGNRRPYKNLTRLLAAFSQSGLAKQGFLLALSGHPDPELNRQAEALGIGADLHYIGFIPEADLPSVYRGAHALALVSLYEGFGFPIIEAMGCGTPALVSAVSAMPEVAAGAALLVAEPRNVAEIADGLVTVCSDTGCRKALQHRGLQRARQFDWGKCAAEYWTRIAPNC